MTRRLLNLVTALSLLLCVAVVALWVRSHKVCDRLWWQADRRAWVVYSQPGRLGVSRNMNDLPPHALHWDRAEPADLWFTPTTWTLLERVGFRTSRWRGGFATPMEVWLVVTPYWALTAALAALPVMRLLLHARRRRRLRLSVGLCPACGYDLRATPGRCPECGAAASVTTSE